jgi:CTP:molybdopterin cytidylyltransferase MocA
VSVNAGLILAAGASRRMGRPKAMLEYQGETFLSRIFRVMRAGGCDPVTIVVAPGCEAWVPADARCVVNPDPDRGMLSSLQCGFADLLSLRPSVNRILFTPLDLPSLREESVRQVVQLAGTAEVVIPRFTVEKRGHPVSVSRAVAEEVLQLSGPDAQPRDVIRRDDSRIRFVDVHDHGVVRDIDEPADYQELLEAEVAEARR